MKVIKQISALKPELVRVKSEGKSIGLVPTMGALHAGHISLVNASIQENDFTIASLFVNPAQFNNPEDYRKYPVSREEDLEMFDKAGVDLVFNPSKEEMYPSDPAIRLDFGALENKMEGKFRPGHFNGVGLIVSKLFHLCLPDRAYFGQKDLQQFLIIKSLVSELSFGIELRMMPILREENGLAMSSRNRRLSREGYHRAGHIYQALQLATGYLKNNKSIDDTTQAVQGYLKGHNIDLEYFEVAELSNLEPVASPEGKKELALCIACYVEGVRLIDNSLLTLR